MKYTNIQAGKFIARPNRFVAVVDIAGCREVCHVKNTGRLQELLLPGADVFVQKVDKTNRKTGYDLISVYKGERLINIDSQAPNKIAAEYLPQIIPGIKLLKAEVRYGSSRFDYYLETDSQRLLVEVKGVTLERAKTALFPDAPTERGLRHLQELGLALAEGYNAIVLFVIKMKGVKRFSPNYATHRAFAETLIRLKKQGARVLAVDCLVSRNELTADKPVEVVLAE